MRISDKVKKHIAFFIHSLTFGGAEKVVMNLLKNIHIRNDLRIDLVVANKRGEFLSEIPSNVRIVDLNAYRQYKLIFPLIKYLKQEQPDYLISNTLACNITALSAVLFARTQTKIAVVEHNVTSLNRDANKYTTFIREIFAKHLYPKAHSVIAVSPGVAEDLERAYNLNKGSVKIIPNPVIDKSILSLFNEKINDRWFEKEQYPVILAVGRLALEKDYVNLVRAFAIVKESKQARLIILGEGPERPHIESIIRDLGLEQDVSLPGFTANPYKYMKKASLLVSSSKTEGFSNVIVEAMACGCPVVSTDCPGPRYILDNGEYGQIVAVGDSDALANAITYALTNKVDKNRLIDRANKFTIQEAANHYLELLKS